MISGIELFGIVAVSVMVIAYALEERAAAFVLLFALSCLAAAAYAAAIHAWPFAVVETLWSVVALRRWLRNRSRRMEPDGR